MSDYASSNEALTASALRNVVREAASERPTAPVYLIGLDGTRWPILAAMIDQEGDDAPNVYLYIERP